MSSSPSALSFRTASSLRPGPDIAAVSLEEQRRRERNANLDRLRVLAIVDVIAFHLDFFDNAGHVFFGMGLPIFLMLTCALGVRRPTLPPAATFIDRRVKRLLLPWLTWWGVYAAFLMLRANLGQYTTPTFAWFEPLMPLYGPAIELWFLPFAFAAGITTYGVVQLTQRGHAAIVIAGSLTLGGAVLAAAEFLDWSSYRDPFAQWFFGAAAILFGVALGRVLRAMPRVASPPRKPLLVAAALSLCLWLAGMVWAANELYTISRYFLALGLILAALAFPGNRDRVTEALLPTLFGVYLVHALVISVGKHQLADMPRLAAVAVVFAVSVAAVMIMRKTPLRAVT